MAIKKTKDKIKVELIEENVKKIIKLKSLKEVNKLFNIKITDDIKFKDNYWEFLKYNINNQEPHSFKYNFLEIDTKYRNYVKIYILRRIRQNIRFTTIKGEFNIIKNFIEWIINQGILYLNDLAIDDIEEYFDLQEVNESTKQSRKSTIKRFIEIINFYNKDICFDEIYEYLTEYNKEIMKKQRENGKFKLISKELYDKTISLAMNDIDNKELNITDRMSACMIVLLGETGMRMCEFKNLEVGQLKEIKINDELEIFNYLKFKTFKTTGDTKGRWTKTFLTPISLKAYRILVDILRDRRGDSKYLYVTPSQTFYQSGPIRFHVLRFFVRHQNEIPLDKNNMRSFIMNENKVGNLGNVATNDMIGSKFYYITPHQFRVHLATTLYKKGYNLDWIRQHMNHMSSAMTEHYIRLQEIEKELDNKELKVETLLKRASKKGLLEDNENNITNVKLKEELKDEEYLKAYKDINNFLKKKKLNIHKDLDTILKLLVRTKTPLIEGELGYCASNGFLKLCERQAYLSSIEDLYHIGVKIPDIEELAFSYMRFKEKIKIIEHNKKIAKLNPKYKREFEKEQNALSSFIDKKLYPELECLNNKLKQENKKEIINKYPDLKEIIENIDKVNEEVYGWKSETLIVS